MLSGISLQPEIGNAVENDILLNNLTLFNSAGVEQSFSQAYSNQQLKLVGNVSFENIDVAPDPSSYNLVVEERGLEIDGEFTNITWTEIANTSGFIDGLIDWNVNLGLFASGSETYRFRMTNYEGGDIICPQQNITQTLIVVYNLICQLTFLILIFYHLNFTREPQEKVT